MNKLMIFGVSIMAVFAIGTISMVPVALAYSGLGAVDGITLEEHLELATRKVEKAEANPATGSGTPYLDAERSSRFIHNCRCNIWWNRYCNVCQRKIWQIRCIRTRLVNTFFLIL